MGALATAPTTTLTISPVPRPGKYACGGAGIVFTEETGMSEEGRKTTHCAGIYRDDHVDKLKPITALVRSLGAVPAIQVGHSGRKASRHGPMEGRQPLTPGQSQAVRLHGQGEAHRGPPP